MRGDMAVTTEDRDTTAMPLEKHEQSSRFVIARANSPQDLADVKTLFEEYHESLGVDISHQNFAEELVTLPGRYGESKGGVLLIARDTTSSQAIGCAAIRALPSSGLSHQEQKEENKRQCELKRLYVGPSARGHRLGRLLAQTALQAATDAGYDEMVLDTLTSMAAATALYKELGFEETPPYNETPLDSRFFAKRLR